MDRPSADAACGSRPPAWLDEIDPAPAPPHLSMGVRALGPGVWLSVDDAARRAKRRVLARHRGEALAALGGTEAPARELADLVARAVGAAAGTTPATGAIASLEAAARLVAEDLCLLVRRDGAWVLVAGCVCFPSHWRLADKLGRPVAEVHAPVPHYAAELATRVDRFLDRLTPQRPVWRRNWLVHTDDRLFAPVPAPPPAPPLSADDAGHRLWLRSERQTLRRLAGTGAIAFTIRTEQAPLAVVATRPALRARMAAAVASWSPETVAYRGGEALRGPLLAWLGANDMPAA